MTFVPAIVVSAHGAAADAGAVLVAEAPKLADMPPPDASRTDAGLAVRAKRLRPFQKGNKAASGRGPSLCRLPSVPIDPAATEAERQATEALRNVHRKAASLKATRARELAVHCGVVTVSAGVQVELVAWARAVAWADYYDRQGDAVRAIAFGEKASGHGLKAMGIAEREAAAALARAPAKANREKLAGILASGTPDSLTSSPGAEGPANAKGT